MRQDFFNFTPQFKLLIAGNHKPGLRSVDEAIRRRFHLIPFTVTIPPEERDPDLAEKLKAEWPGILRWMIEGCRTGAGRPDAARHVLDATAAYLDAEDAIAHGSRSARSSTRRLRKPQCALRILENVGRANRRICRLTQGSR